MEHLIPRNAGSEQVKICLVKAEHTSGYFVDNKWYYGGVSCGFIIKADKTLYEDIYITGFNTGLNSPNSITDLRLFGCLLLDGAIYEDFRVVADDDGSGIYWRDVDNTVPIPKVDKTGLADPADFFDQVYNMATAHE